MSLSEVIEQVRRNLQERIYRNEAALSQGVVLPVLAQLGWPTNDTRIAAPEFGVEGRRVDFALCCQDGRPTVFVEVKQSTKAPGAEEQLLTYAYHKGVLLAILTDGQEWHFYLSMLPVDATERCVYRLDLVEREIEESIERLEMYLSPSRVLSGEAVATLEEGFRSRARMATINSTLPRAWRALQVEPDGQLLEIVAERVADMCGFRPELSQVAEFLTSISKSNPPMTTNGPVSLRHDRARATVQRSEPAERIDSTLPMASSFGYSFEGRFVPRKNGIDTVLGVFQLMATRDPDFLDRFAAVKHGRKRRYIARRPDDLYPGRPDLATHYFVPLLDGWFLGTNYSTHTMESIVILACRVMGWQYGTDFKVNWGSSTEAGPS